MTIRIVSEEDVPALCGAAAAACYSPGGNGGRMVVPAGKDIRVAATFLHEYGHHLDRSWSVNGVPELNGTQVWWGLRGMAALVAQGAVAFDYSRGWNRSIGEIFAEDYAWIHIPYQHAIPWLSPPDEALRTALFAELGGQPTAQLPAIPAAGPLVINRNGTLAAKRSQVVPFGLLGPGRRVTMTATVNKATRAGTRARMRRDVQRHSRRHPAVHEGPLDPHDQRPEPRPRRVQRAARQHDGRAADVHASPAARDRDLGGSRRVLRARLVAADPGDPRRGCLPREPGPRGARRQPLCGVQRVPGPADGDRASSILPDVRGLYRFYEELALRFAERGYTAIAFDYFGRTAGVEKRDDDFEYMEHVKRTTAEGVRRTSRRSSRSCARRCSVVFTVGFCFGGRHSWLAAAGGHDLHGAIGFYGRPGTAQDGHRGRPIAPPTSALRSSG